MDKSILKKVNLFSDLNDDELEKIYSHSTIKKFNKGEMIFFETEPYNGFYIVIDGSVKIFKISEDGREHVIHFVYPTNTFAEAPLFEQYEKIKNEEFTYPANSMALEDNTKLILIRSDVFYGIIEMNKSICLKMLSGLSRKLRHLNSHIENISQGVPKRLSLFLLEELKKSEKKEKDIIELKFSKHDLASYLGTIDETLSRCLKKLQESNVISVKGRSIHILNKSALLKTSGYKMKNYHAAE
ncbi:MAG: Crp/Fnr family transcriptional regulator [Ignavibacteria bacterium]|nr:Crp/Fnr family transcriptional regulator [Ignavibacteria bacterium]